MRLLIRALGSPVPEEVEADSEGTLLDLYQLIQQDTSKINPDVERHRLVRRCWPAVWAHTGGDGSGTPRPVVLGLAGG